MNKSKQGSFHKERSREILSWKPLDSSTFFEKKIDFKQLTNADEESQYSTLD